MQLAVSALVGTPVCFSNLLFGTKKKQYLISLDVLFKITFLPLKCLVSYLAKAIIEIEYFDPQKSSLIFIRAYYCNRLFWHQKVQYC